MPDSVEIIYDQYRDRQTRPSLDEILEILNSVISMYSRIYIIVDAVDECQSSEGYRPRFLASILSVQAKTGANLLVTSRPIPDIIQEFKGCLSLEILAHDEDIRKYLNNHMSRLPTFVSSRPKLQDEISTEIVKAAEGM